MVDSNDSNQGKATLTNSKDPSATDILDKVISPVKKAQQRYAQYSQEHVNEIFRQAALAANTARIKLAKMAAEETSMGIAEDKAIKNHFASEYIYNKYKDDKTCGVIEEDKAFGIMKIAEPIGIIFSPHPRAKLSTHLAAKVVILYR